MRKNRSVMTVAAVGAILILLTTLAFFLLDIEKIKLYWCAFGFLVFAEIIFCAGLIGLRRIVSVFARSGVTVALSLYLISTLIVTLCASNFEEKVNPYILLHITVIAVFAIIAVLLLSFAGRIGDSDRATAASRFFMQDCEQRAQNLAQNQLYAAYAAPLNKLYESVKYADNVGSSSVDGTIGDQLISLENALKEGAEESIVNELIKSLSTSITKRNAEMTSAKRGGF